MDFRPMEYWNVALDPLVGMNWWMAAGTLLALYVIYEQLSFLNKRKHLPGPSFVMPFIGNVIGMVADPTGFWDQQAFAARKVSPTIYIRTDLNSQAHRIRSDSG